jgi:hypothetical protein
MAPQGPSGRPAVACAKRREHHISCWDHHLRQAHLDKKMYKVRRVGGSLHDRSGHSSTWTPSQYFGRMEAPIWRFDSEAGGRPPQRARRPSGPWGGSVLRGRLLGSQAGHLLPLPSIEHRTALATLGALLLVEERHPSAGA